MYFRLKDMATSSSQIWESKVRDDMTRHLQSVKHTIEINAKEVKQEIYGNKHLICLMLL